MPHYAKHIYYVLLVALFFNSCAAVRTEDNVPAGYDFTSDYVEKSYDSYYNFSLSKHAFHNKDLYKAIEYMEIAETSDPESSTK